MAFQGPNLELGLVFLQDSLVVVFPKLDCGIFSADSLQNLLAAGVLVRELCTCVSAWCFFAYYRFARVGD